MHTDRPLGLAGGSQVCVAKPGEPRVMDRPFEMVARCPRVKPESGSSMVPQTVGSAASLRYELHGRYRTLLASHP